MDWGLGNPNKTAALIACLMISIWAGAYKWKRGFWVALPAFTILGWCLVQTYSRGGMLALIVGIAILLIWTPRPWPKARWIAAVVSLWIVGLFILYAKAETRYGQGLFGEDQSINSRLIIWKHFPEMLAAAPWGWGWGHAGDAYTQWFQPPDQSINYLNLVNSHFTWMVENGWVASVLYLYAWLVIVLLCWPATPTGLRAVPLAVWAAFGVGGCFSHVQESAWLWILPLTFLGYALWNRIQIRQWPVHSSFGLGALTSVSMVAILVAIGYAETSLPIKMTGRVVAVGNGPEVSVIFVDRNVMGKFYGHTFRQYLNKNPSQQAESTYIITESQESIMPSKCHQLIISGRWWQDAGCALNVNRADQVILINPATNPEIFKWNQSATAKTSVYFGEYSQSAARSSWASCPGFRTLVIEGAADFMPSWPQVILKSSGT